MDERLIRFLGRMLRGVLIVALLGVLSNDTIRTVSAFSHAAVALNAAMNAAIDVVSVGATEGAAMQAADQAARDNGCVLADYQQMASELTGTRHVKISMRVSSTLTGTVLGPAIAGLIEQTPPSAWYDKHGIEFDLGYSKQVDLYGAASP
jgi:hypothetical protein